MGSEASLKAINYRLTSIPPQNLPHVLSSLQQSLIECKVFFTSPAALTKNTSSSVILERSKKLFTSFLTDAKSAERRWTAVVLIKTTIDIGSLAILQDSVAWIRGLLSILTKGQDPPSTKRVAILALSKIFFQTHQHPTLVREITTPNLPPFITASLQNIAFKPTLKPALDQLKTRRVLTPVILEILTQLIPRHPTIFRSFENQIRELVLPLIGSNPSSVKKRPESYSTLNHISHEARHAARELFAVLHFTAPKNGGPQEWNNSMTDLVRDAHATADQVFRSIVEEWQSSTGVVTTMSRPDAYAGQPKHISTSDSALSLPPWEGTYAGCERLVDLLSLLQCFSTTGSSSQVFFPIARITDLLLRLMLTTTPSGKEPKTNQRHNDSCSREEREALWSALPIVHVAVLEFVQALAQRFVHALMPVTVLILDHVEWLIKRESFSPALRQHGYTTSARLLAICGRGLRTNRVRHMGELMKLACHDIIPEPSPSASNDPKVSASANGLNTVLAPAKTEKDSAIVTPNSPQKYSALDFVTTFLSYVLPSQTPTALRALIDRTVILANHKEAMLASVINPPASTTAAGGKVRSSILPFLARQYGQENDVEGFLRPRLPIIMTNTTATSEDRWEEEDIRADGGVDDDAVRLDYQDDGERLRSYQSDDPQSDIRTHLEHQDPETHSRKRSLDQPAAGAQNSNGVAPGHVSPAKRQRMSPARPTLEPHVESHIEPHVEPHVEPNDVTVRPAPPFAVAVASISDSHPDATNGATNVVVKPAADVLAPPDAGEGQEQTIHSSAMGNMGQIEDKNAGTGDGDSDSDMSSIPELVLKSSDSEEEGEEEDIYVS